MYSTPSGVAQLSCSVLFFLPFMCELLYSTAVYDCCAYRCLVFQLLFETVVLHTPFGVAQPWVLFLFISVVFMFHLLMVSLTTVVHHSMLLDQHFGSGRTVQFLSFWISCAYFEMYTSILKYIDSYYHWRPLWTIHLMVLHNSSGSCHTTLLLCCIL